MAEAWEPCVPTARPVSLAGSPPYRLRPKSLLLPFSAQVSECDPLNPNSTLVVVSPAYRTLRAITRPHVHRRASIATPSRQVVTKSRTRSSAIRATSSSARHESASNVRPQWLHRAGDVNVFMARHVATASQFIDGPPLQPRPLGSTMASIFSIASSRATRSFFIVYGVRRPRRADPPMALDIPATPRVQSPSPAPETSPD